MSQPVSPPNVVTFALDALRVDPTLFSPRTVPVNAAYLARLIDTGRTDTLPPLRVVVAADTQADWWGCPLHYKREERANWVQAAQQTPFTQRPLQPDAVVVDGTTVFWALRAAGVTEWPCIVEPEFVTSPAEVRLRALAANFHNAQALTDGCLRATFAQLWLGRPVKDSHETWEPTNKAVLARAALPMELIADTLGRGLTWCSDMKRYCQVHYVLGLDLGYDCSRRYAKIPADKWRSVAYDGDSLRLWPVDNALLTVAQMTATQLGRLADVFASGATPPAVPPKTVVERPQEPPVAPTGQYLMDFGEDLVQPSETLAHLADLAPQLHKDVLVDRWPYVLQAASTAVRARDAVRSSLRAQGVEV